MNKKIRQLGIQAGLIVDEWDGFNQQQLNPAEQKFADLIVRECINACGSDFGTELIKKHFGVEE